VAALSRLGPPPDSPDFSDDVSGRLDDADRIAALHRSLSRLRPDELEVLALCAWSGLSYAEAAGALGVPVGTVRSRLSRLSRARVKLLKATERELRKSPRKLTAGIDQLMNGAAQADPSFKEA
jgi:RNA polymerase sigma-70 factor (ECF subfamily)